AVGAGEQRRQRLRDVLPQLGDRGPQAVAVRHDPGRVLRLAQLAGEVVRTPADEAHAAPGLVALDLGTHRGRGHAFQPVALERAVALDDALHRLARSGVRG